MKFVNILRSTACFFLCISASQTAISEEGKELPIKVFCMIEGDNVPGVENFNSELIELRGYGQLPQGKHLINSTENYEFWVSSGTVLQTPKLTKILAFEAVIYDIKQSLRIAALSGAEENGELPRRAQVELIRNPYEISLASRLTLDCHEYR